MVVYLFQGGRTVWLKLWDVISGEELKTLKKYKSSVESVIFSRRVD